MLEITDIEPEGTAARLGLMRGDRIVSVNNEEINDVIDFAFHVAEEHITLKVLTASRETKTYRVDKAPDDRLGISFSPLQVKRCRNKCIFCFVDQMPSGCRQSLSVKDDDFRASFLYGNYITLGSLTEQDWQRIFKQRLSPLYISVHTTDPALRSFVLGNRKSPNIIDSLKRLAGGGILMHTQIVLCPGINDGTHLEKTLDDLSGLYPAVASVAVVPVGMTAFRKGLFPLRAFTRSEARSVIDFTTRFGNRFKRKQGTRLVFASDEFYIKAKLPVPSRAFYEEFPQIENGVGMVSDFLHSAARLRLPARIDRVRATMVTGASFGPILSTILERFRMIHGLSLKIVKVRNNFFGPSVTVAGLLTGRDIMSSLKGRTRQDIIFIPADAISDDGLFLDGMSVTDLSDRAGAEIFPVRYIKDILEKIHAMRRSKA